MYGTAKIQHFSEMAKKKFLLLLYSFVTAVRRVYSRFE